MLRRAAEIRARRIEKRRERAKTRLRVPGAVLVPLIEPSAETNQPLRRNRGRRTVHRLVGVERIGVTAGPVAELR